MPFTLEEQLKCVRREISQRGYVYPRRVADGKMTKEQANHEIDCMMAVMATLESLAAKERLL